MRGTVQVLDRVMDMVLDPMEEVILEVLLGIQVHHPSGTLELDLIEGPFQPHGKRGDLFVTPWLTL